MKFSLPILLISLSLTTQAQFRNFSEPLQNDSIYRKARVISRLIKYPGSSSQSKNLETFNERGQIAESIIYYLINGDEKPRYQSSFIYDSLGKLVSSISKDLICNNCYPNETTSKYEYNLSGKLIRKMDIGLKGIISRETIYVENPHTEITKDYNDKGELNVESTSIIDTNDLIIETQIRYNFYDSSKIMTDKNSWAYEIDNKCRITKCFNPIGKTKFVYHYSYNNKGLLTKVLYFIYNETQVKISYQYY